MKTQLAALLFFLAAVSAVHGQTIVSSPDGNVQFKLMVDNPQLRYSVLFKNTQAIETSPMIFKLDGVNLCDRVKISGKPLMHEINETFPYRGVHSTASNHCIEMSIPLQLDNIAFTLQVRAYNDGIAFRTIVPRPDKSDSVPDELTVFTLPAGTMVWHHNLRGHYEGDYTQSTVDQMNAGEWCAPAMTFKLPGAAGYGCISEAALINYSGMALQADGHRGFVIGLGHRQPVSYPYELRYSKADVERIQHAAVITGSITTPWRVVILASDLNTLVNSDIIPACCPAPDPQLFPNGINTDWVKPGRASWLYTDGGDRSYEGLLNFSKLTGQMGFEYQVLEGMWHRWSDDDLRNFVETSKKYGVNLFVWEFSKNLRDPEKRQAFFKRLHDNNIAGAKIDFFDNEQKDTIDLYNAIFHDAAEQHILLDLHGANKPTGEQRTWPNELTREAIHGMEVTRILNRAFHETTLPFTRYIAGPAEYTPVLFNARRADTTAVHQIATAVIFTAPLLTYSLSPQHMLESPAVDIFKTIPSTWDQTIVLPPSEISQAAVFARRSGDTWFLAVANGPAPRHVSIPLTFLGEGDYKALTLTDGNSPATDSSTTQPRGTVSMNVENKTMTRNNTIELDLAWGGGFVGRFNK